MTKQPSLLTSIEINPSFRFDQATDSSSTRNNFFGQNNDRSLKTNIFNSNDSKGLSTDSEFRIIRKFKKPKRELKAEYYLVTSDNETASTLENSSNYYLPVESDSIIEQDKTNEKPKKEYLVKMLVKRTPSVSGARMGHLTTPT